MNLDMVVYSTEQGGKNERYHQRKFYHRAELR